MFPLLLSHQDAVLSVRERERINERERERETERVKENKRQIERICEPRNLIFIRIKNFRAFSTFTTF